MNKNLSALNEYLFDTLNRLTNDDLSGETLQEEINRSQAVVQVATTVIRIGDLALRAAIAAEDCGFQGKSERHALPPMLEAT